MTPLELVISELGATSGTIHHCDGRQLKLVEAVGIPADVMPLIEAIPRGKGMAGEAWLRAEPVTTCNLPDDPSETIQSGARRVNARAAVAIPLLSNEGAVRAVIGFGFPEEVALDDQRVATMAAIAGTLIEVQSGALE